MAIVHGKAGEWARVQGTVFGLWPVFIGVFVLGFAAAAVCFSQWRGTFAALAVLAAAGIVFALMRGLSQIESFFKGARGEERVAGILRSLNSQYHLFNDFIACGKHIDHVIVGPLGVFAIETKNWRNAVTIEDGHILVDGRLPSRPPLAQALREATLVKNELAKLGWTGKVTPVLAFASDTFTARVAELQGAVIINARELGKSFETERVIIPPAELERLVSLMENNR